MSNGQDSPQFSEEYIKEQIASVPFWWHRIEVAPGIFTPGNDYTQTKKVWMRLPDDMSGKRVLDIGAYEGFFSFECERRGADVTAMDVKGPTDSGFSVAHKLLGSKVKHIRKTVYNLDPNEMEQFDIVLFLGVLYHLRHPLLALDRIHSVCKDLLILESQVCDEMFLDEIGQSVSLNSFSPTLTKVPLAQFYPYDELNNDSSNWWSPNVVALEKMIETSGFEPELVYNNGVRAVFHCRKKQQGPGWANTDASAVQHFPDMLESTSPPLQEGNLRKQLQKVTEELQATRARLIAFEDTRTWRWASKIAYSAPGRVLSRLLRPLGDYRR